MGALIIVLESLFVQLVFSTGIVGLCGAFISLSNKCFYEYTGKTGVLIMKISGVVGTPVHELSHALMCLIFGHKIHEIKIYNFRRKSKTLGYVSHSYVKKNLYQQIGNFFIGVSPIIAGGLVVTGLVWLLTPEMYSGIMKIVAPVTDSADMEFFKALLECVAGLPKTVFNLENLKLPFWWICMALVFAVTVHMEISRSDIKGGLKGLLVILAALFAVDMVLGFLFPDALGAFTSFMVSVGVYFSVFLVIPIFFSCLLLIFSLVIYLIKMTAKSVSNDRK